MRAPQRIIRAKRIVTLPPDVVGADVRRFIDLAKAGGADAIEIRNDLHAVLPEAGSSLPILVSERGAPLTPAWTERAEWIDREVGSAHVDERTILSFHAPSSITPDEAVALWRAQPLGRAHAIKHVEPLGDLADAKRLFVTQRRLEELLGEGRVTVLATGASALPFRALLSERNLFDYVALDPSFSAAKGQRLLADATRSAGVFGPRLAILGSRIGHSRSPRIHPQPFDRIDLESDVDLPAILDALHPHYRGFSVTSPFKRAAAAAVAAPIPSVNTLARTVTGYRATNTDVDGARAALAMLGVGELSVLGEGGVAWALRAAASDLGVHLDFVKREELRGAVLEKTLLWTWPTHLEAPELSVEGKRVGVIAYGRAARTLARMIEGRGGKVIGLGARWFVAQARAQRKFWEAS